jgi:glycosyltransferase involved in cell wall biosynthesis
VTVAFSQKAFVLCALSQPLVRRPLVWGLNDLLDKSHFSPPLLRGIVGLANAAADRVVVNSKASAAAFQAAGGRANFLSVVYPGIDVQQFCEALPADEVPPRNGRLRIGCFGRIARWKGQDILIRAVASLPTAQVVVVGSALFADKAYEEELRSLIRDLGVEDRVHLLGHRRDVASLMKACDILCHTSRDPEPFGQVVVEGLAAGRPVIATNAGGVTEIVRDGVDGLLVAPGSVDELTGKLASLLCDAQRREQLGRAGEKRAAAFGTNRMVQGFREVLGDFRPGLWGVPTVGTERSIAVLRPSGP